MYVSKHRQTKGKWACKKLYLWKDIIVILLYKVVSVFCLSWWISLTAKPILFSVTVKLLIGPGKVLNYFWRGYLYPPPPKNIFLTLFKLKFEMGWGRLFPLLPVIIFLSVEKDLANRWTDMVLLYSKASHRSRDSFRLFVFHLFTPSEIESPSH